MTVTFMLSVSRDVKKEKLVIPDLGEGVAYFSQPDVLVGIHVPLTGDF